MAKVYQWFSPLPDALKDRFQVPLFVDPRFNPVGPLRFGGFNEMLDIFGANSHLRLHEIAEMRDSILLPYKSYQHSSYYLCSRFEGVFLSLKTGATIFSLVS